MVWQIVVWIGVAVVALLFWAFLPARLIRDKNINDDKDRIESEDVYRKTIGQAIGAVAVAVGLVITYRQLLLGEQSARDAENSAATAQREATDSAVEARFEHGFDVFKSTDRISRIGGIYNLELLLDADRRDKGGREGPILEGLAAAALEYSQQPNPKFPGRIPVDAQAALRALSRSKPTTELPLRFDGANFVGAQIPNSWMNGSSFFRANFSGSDLYNSQLYQGNFRDSVIRGASFVSSNLANASFEDANGLPGPNYAVASAESEKDAVTNFSGARMFGARLDRARLTRANFGDACLWNAVLVKARLQRSDLRDAQLFNADMTNVDLRHATAVDAKFSSDGLGIKFAPAPDQVERFKGADFRGSNLQGASFRKLDLERAQFDGADLSYADFTEATNLGIDERRSVLCATKMPDGTVKNPRCTTKRISAERPELNSAEERKKVVRQCSSE